MARIPFGIARLDEMIDGGAPSGSTVLLASEVGAGGREFLYTCAALSGLAHVDEEQFDLFYGDLHERSELPESVHYISFTDGRDALVREMRFTMDDRIIDAGVEAITFKDLSQEYFQQSHVPSTWYAERARTIASLGDQHDRDDVLDAVGAYFDDVPSESLVLVDSVTDLISVPESDMTWTDIALLLKGLKKASHRWGGLVLLLVSLDTLSDVQLGRLMEATDGSMIFEWESGGSERARTMYVKQFRGVLSRLEEEDIIQFETDINDSGFDISDVRKIR